MDKASDALQRLKAGNERFVTSEQNMTAPTGQSRRSELLESQAPFAIILGCSDSRVPAELVFDQGLGDLFVVRVAGNIVAPSLIGSVEFSAVHHGPRLVVVLGHTSCGAVQASVAELKQPSGNVSSNLQSVVDCIQPSIQKLIASGVDKDDPELVSLATRANVLSTVEALKHESAVLEELIENDGLRIVGAEYSLESGKVEFYS